MIRRIYALVLRYFYLHRHSIPRIMEVFFWPLMNLLVWGFLAAYVEQISRPGLVSFLFGGMILWEVLYRAQQSVSLSITEEFWVRNILNLFIAPVRVAEIVAGACVVGVVKCLVTTAFLLLLSRFLYGFDILPAAWAFTAFYGALLLFGWAVGLVTMGLIFRYGRASEALIWGIPFLIQPVCAVFYPVEILPGWLRPLSLAMPATWAFEGMRLALAGGGVSVRHLALAWGLGLPWLAGAALYFAWTLRRVRELGNLSRQITE